MNIHYEDLLRFLSTKPSKSDLSDMLFQLGHEHEIQGDIFNMEFTPNRGDCLSLLGLSRDLNVFFGNLNNIEIYQDDIDTLELDFENLAPNDCPRISFLEIEVENINLDYQPYLENYFQILDNKKKNFFTDISNYILYELGQPTHCYDKKLINQKIIFENKKCNNNFKSIVGSEINLEDHNCVFLMGDEIINLAGIMGGDSTACSEKTNTALIECAYFNAESILGKSVKYNIASDAAYRFERGVDKINQEFVLRRFIKIVDEHAEIKSIRVKSHESQKYNQLNIPFDNQKINKILGINISEEDYKEILNKLGFKIAKNIEVPSYRHDICSQNDLAEEVARVIGYDNINKELLVIKKNNQAQEINRIKLLESFFINNGFSEVINFPFSSEQDDHSIVIDNPLDSNRGYFRTSLKESLIENLLYNERRQKDSIKLFEISDIYTKNNDINSKKNLGLIISGRLDHNHKDFSKKLNEKYLNFLLNDHLLDHVFRIEEIQRSNLDTKKKDKIFYVEIEIEDIPTEFFNNIEPLSSVPNFFKYKPISDYPSSTRDFSFSISDPSKVIDIKNYFEKMTDEIIKDIFIFDFYHNKEINIVKLGYRFIFQSTSKTLSEDEITKKIQEILEPALSIDGVTIQGM